MNEDTIGISRAALWVHVMVAAAVLIGASVLPVLFVGDVARYADIATGPMFWSGQEVEFPLVTAGFVWLTARWGATSLLVVAVTNLVLDAATCVVLARTWGNRAANHYLALSALLLPLTLFRLDHLSVLLAVGALALARAGRDLGGGLALAVAVHAKLWPAALIAAYTRARRRLLATAIAATGTIAVVWMGVFGVGAAGQVIGFRGSSGWQIESLGGSLLRIVQGGDARFESGAWRVGQPPVWATLALLGVGLVVFLLSRRVPSLERRQLVLVLGLMLASPLLSPQFLIWLCPLVAIQSDPSYRRRQAQLLGVAILYTMLMAVYYGYVIQGELLATIALGLRNACLVGMLVLGLMGSRRQPHHGQPQAHELATSTP